MHVPFPVLVNVRVTEPAAVSAGLNKYVAFKVLASGAKVPLPDEAQVPPVDTVIMPSNRILPTFAQMLVSLPAADVGLGVIVMTIVSVTARHIPFPVDVSINVTVPVLISAPLGVYVAIRDVGEGE